MGSHARGHAGRGTGAAGNPEAGEIVVVTDPGDGHPTEVRVDHHAEAIDDESRYAVMDYEAGG